MPSLTVGIVVRDDDTFEVHADNPHQCAVNLTPSSYTTIQGTPGAVRRLARALLDAADQADAITTGTWK